MCFVSLLTTGLELQRPPFNTLQNWPPQQVFDLSDIIARLDRIDKALGLSDCKDEVKDKFLDELEALVQKYRREMSSIDPKLLDAADSLREGMLKSLRNEIGKLRELPPQPASLQREVLQQPLWNGEVFPPNHTPPVNSNVYDDGHKSVCTDSDQCRGK